jgi:hypothetical protein
MPEAPAQKYRRKAEECRQKAETADGAADKQAWQHLAEDWSKLALGVEQNG